MSVHLPGLDTKNGIFFAWWFEPLVATLSFAGAIHVYWFEERRRGLSRNNHLLEAVGVTSRGDIYNSFGMYWMGIWLLKCLAGKSNAPSGIPTSIDSAFVLICEVVAGIFMYDALFFFVHWAMHEVPCLRKFHSRHHDALENTLEARDVLRHSIVDGSLQVLCNILVQQSNPWGTRKSLCARILHNIVVTWMLTESHTASPTPNIWRRFCVGVREHRLHHLGIFQSESSYGRFHRHQQFFGYLDNLRAWTFAQYHSERLNIKAFFVYGSKAKRYA